MISRFCAYCLPIIVPSSLPHTIRQYHQHHPLANAARMATEAMEELKNKLYEQAEREYPGADWLEEYTKEYTGEIWPPRITGKETDK